MSRKINKKKVFVLYEGEISQSLKICLKILEKKGMEDVIGFKNLKTAIRLFRKDPFILFFMIDETIELNHKLMESIDYIKKLKKVPFFFLTKKPNELVQFYAQKLFLYGEMDDFFDTNRQLELKRNIDFKISNLMKSQNPRVSKRIPTNLTGIIQSMHPESSNIPVQIKDISLLGIGLNFDTNALNLNYNQKLLLTIPVTNQIRKTPHLSEFLKGLVRIKRQSLKGNEIGCEWWSLGKHQERVLRNLIQDQMILQNEKRQADNQILKPLLKHAD